MIKDEEIAELKKLLALAQQQKTLRDEFAMAALPALIGLHRADLRWQDVAPQAYALADKMMEARKWPMT